MTSRKQPQKIEPNANSLERAVASVGERLSVKETEETWDTIADALQELSGLIDQVGSILPNESVQGLRSVAHAITSAASSERSRLSSVAIALLTTAACQLGRAFETLIPCFLPGLLALCSRTSKVFIARARACIIAIVQNTQSPLILSYLTHYAKDKSTSLRLTVAESALACLNSFNPPDLQRETRSKEVELLIKCAATDANPDVRKTGKKLYDAYKVLLPERVESFAAPLTPTVRKYLNINVKASKGLARQQQPSNPLSRPSSALSSRSGLASSSSSVPAESYVRSLPPPTSTSLSRLQPPPSNSSTSAHHNLPSRPHTSLGTVTASPSQDPRLITSSRAHHMPPPDLLPSRPTHPPSSSSQQLHLTTSREQTRERSRAGPLRPSPLESLVPSSSSQETPSTEVKRLGGGARRVLLPNATSAANSGSGTKDREVERKGPARPISLCEASTPLEKTPEIEQKEPQDAKEPAPALRKESRATTAPKKPTSTNLHKAQEKSRDTVALQSTRMRENDKDRVRLRHAQSTSRVARPTSAEPPPRPQVPAQQLKAVPAAVKTKQPAIKVQGGTSGNAANAPTRRKAAGKTQSQPVSQGSKAPAISLKPAVAHGSTSDEAGTQAMTSQEVHHNKILITPLSQSLQAQPQPQPNSATGESEAEDTDEQVQEEPYGTPENVPQDSDSSKEQKGQPLRQQEVAEVVQNRSPESPPTHYDGKGTVTEAELDEGMEHDIAHAPEDDGKCTPALPSSPPVPPTPPAPVFALTIDPCATPKATTSSPSLTVEQTPISALVHSIQHGFVWTPHPEDESLSYIGEREEDEEWEGDTTFGMNGEEFDVEATRFLTTRPLTWGSLDAARLYTQADKQMVQTGS